MAPSDGFHPGYANERRHPRHTVDVRVLVTHGPDERSKDSAYGRSRDVSEGGIGTLLPAAKLAVGEVVNLEFSLPGSDERLSVRGMVRHQTGFMIGFEFLAITSEQRRIIRRACTLLPTAP